MSENFLAEEESFSATAMMRRDGEKRYSFEREAAVNGFFNGLACIERFGVPNGI
ncbi:MAG TPA: hypothetical protein PKD12_04725 [Nitrospira sp.]|nr:hypothetical protein [Nitrospira sp.]